MISFDDYNYIFESKLTRHPPYSARELLEPGGLNKIPKTPGLYYWWLKQDYAKSLGLTGHTVKGYTLVYHGTGKNIRQRLVEWELADLNGKFIRKNAEVSHDIWVKARARDAVKSNPGVGQPARSVRALIGTHWVDYEATQEFLDNMYVTVVEVPIKADPSDKKAWNAEYEYKVVKRLETSQVRKHNPGLNIKQLKDRFVASQRTELGKLSKEKTLEFAKSLFGDNFEDIDKFIKVRRKIDTKVSAASSKPKLKPEV